MARQKGHALLPSGDAGRDKAKRPMTSIAIERPRASSREADLKDRAASAPGGNALPKNALSPGETEPVAMAGDDGALSLPLLLQLGYGDTLSRIAEVGGFASTKESAKIRCQQMAMKSQARLRK